MRYAFLFLIVGCTTAAPTPSAPTPVAVKPTPPVANVTRDAGIADAAPKPTASAMNAFLVDAGAPTQPTTRPRTNRPSFRIPRQVCFDRSSADLGSVWDINLDAIAEIVNNNPDYGSVHIEGNAAYDENVVLPTSRASAVQAGLLRRGVKANRLVVVPNARTSASRSRCVDVVLVP